MAEKKHSKQIEWQSANEIPILIGLLGELATDRKMRLFGTACCRRIQHLLLDPRSIAALRAAEQFADGEISDDQRRALNRDAYRALEDIPDDGGPEREVHEPEYHATNLNTAWFKAADAPHILSTGGTPDFVGSRSAQRCVEAVWYEAISDQSGAQKREILAQCDLVRDIFGNPFRPTAFDPAWRTSTVVAIARGMYESRNFDAMPILADALQDAGCEDEAVLTHCRDASLTHVRGCWVVDLVLGKS